MSWSASYGSLEQFEKDEPQFPFVGQGGYAEEEVAYAKEYARSVARQIINSGVAGEGDFAIYLNGHANPGRKKNPKYASDSVSVTVSRKDY